MPANKVPGKGLEGFTREFGLSDRPCVGVFGGEGTGKTRLCATAAEWADERGTAPGWIVCDRKTRRTVIETCELMGVQLPYMNAQDFITQRQALELATTDDFDKTKKVYMEAMKKVLDAAVRLVDSPDINPIVIDSGTQLWDWIGFSHFGRKQDVGRSRVWGPPKQDWTDMMDALKNKVVLITLKAKDEYRNDERTGKLTWDGPPHLGFTVTTIVRLTQDMKRKLADGETFVDRFGLDVIQSQDNKGREGEEGVLLGEGITFTNLWTEIGRD